MVTLRQVQRATYTIMKPAVIEPSHMPKPKRRMANPAKFLHAAKQQRKIAHSVMLKLFENIDESASRF
jgi:hypothetical protein